MGGGTVEDGGGTWSVYLKAHADSVQVSRAKEDCWAAGKVFS